MTLKMVAIGILVLLGLSSVMNPKTFRAFLGGLATLCMALFFGYVIFGGKQQNQIPLLSQLQQQIGIQPDWVESAKKRSEVILKDFNSGTVAPDASDLLPTDGIPRVKKELLIASPIVVDNATSVETITAKMRVRIEQYLKRYREVNTDVGVDRLTYRNIDTSLITDKRAKLKDGRNAIFLVFDEAFAQHVRAKGRHAVMKERMKQLAVGLVSAGAVLTLAFASLKYINRRNEPLQLEDYLRQGDVSMV